MKTATFRPATGSTRLIDPRRSPSLIGRASRIWRNGAQPKSPDFWSHFTPSTTTAWRESLPS